MSSFTYWLERNGFWIILAFFGILVATAWIVMTIKVFPNEIRDLYSSSKVHCNHTFSSWRKTIIRRKNNARRKRYHFNARSFQTEEEPQTVFEMKRLRGQHNDKTRPKPKSEACQQQKGAKRRTRIKVVNEIYGQIVGYEDSPGPSYQCKVNLVAPIQKAVSEKPKPNHLNHDTNIRGLESRFSKEKQPRCHVKGRNLKEETRVAGKFKYNNESAIRSGLNILSSGVPVSVSKISIPVNNLFTPDNLRVMGCTITRQVKSEDTSSKARKNRLMKAMKEEHYEDLKGTWV